MRAQPIIAAAITEHSHIRGKRDANIVQETRGSLGPQGGKHTIQMIRPLRKIRVGGDGHGSVQRNHVRVEVRR